MKILREHGIIVVVLLALLMAFVPGMVRSMGDNPVLVGGESYFNLRMGHSLQESIILHEDPVQKNPYRLDIFHYLVFMMLKLTSNDQALLLSSVLLAMASAILFYMSLVRIGMGLERSFIAFLVFIISPIYLYTSTVLNSFSLTLFLITLSMYFYAGFMHYHRPYLMLASLIPAIITVITEPSVFLVFIIVLVIHSYHSNRSYGYPIITLVAGMVLGIGHGFYTNEFATITFVGGLDFLHYITDFGAVIGYPFFQVLLTLVTVFLYWKEALDTKIVNVCLILLIVASSFMPGSRLLVGLGLCVYTSYTIDFFLQRKWIVPVLKDLTLLIVLSSLLFSSVSFTTRIANMEPTYETVKVLEQIRIDRREGEVLSSVDNGFIIEYYTLKKAYLDKNTKDLERFENAQLIFDTTRPKSTKELLKDNGIRYIYIDPAMKEEHWKRRTGLLLVMEVSENFIKLGGFDEREAWLYITI